MDTRKVTLSIVALINLAGIAYSQTLPNDPDVFANRQNYTGAPHFVRSAQFERAHVRGSWPFIVDSGEVTCITVDGAALAMFEMPGVGEPFVIAENIFATFIGTLVTGRNDYIREDYEPAKLVEDIEKTYIAALIQCGPPYAQ